MSDPASLLADAVRIWAKAQVVYDAPSWEGVPEARALVERIAATPECHGALPGLLVARNQLIVAYALQALDLSGNPVLAHLPDELCDRREQVTFVCGSFKTSMDLGGYARQLRKRARGQRPDTPPDPRLL